MYRENDTIGPYILRRKLGKGAFGVVWLAEKRTAFGSFDYALKMAARDDIDLNAVAEEVTTWKDAKGHPNVLPLIDADVYGEDFVIVSEYAPEGSLQTWLNANGGHAPDMEAAVKMTNGILDGLIHLHAKRIIHRDLKPDNILLRGATPMLADFGLARVLKTSQSSNIAGTPVYMSPEAIRNERTVQVDVWGVGVMLYQMLCGRLPFAGDNIMSLMYAILNESPAPLPASVPDGLRGIVERAMHKDTAQRHATAQALRDDLRRFTEQQAEVRRRAAQQATETDLARRAAEEAARLRVEEERRQQAVAERQQQQQAEARRLAEIERQQREAAEKRRAEAFRVPPSGGGAADTPQRFVADAPPTKVGAQNDSARRWPKWAAGGAAVVLSVVLLGYSLSGYFTNSASPPAGTTTTTTTAKPAVGDATTLSGNVKMEFVQIPSGRFTRGSPANEEGRDDDEGPQHEVTISKPFNLGKYEVTQAQWKAVMSELPDKCDFGSLTGEFVGDDKPIICVSWDDAQRFIAKLNAQASGGGKYRLPTEAEWEYAARAGEKGLYAGNLDEMGWYDGNAGGKTHPAGQKKANAFGLYDMHGNVWEWCGDWYGPYSSSAATDPRGPTTGSIRANRGGGWSSTAQNARSADRFSNSPGSRGGDLGFRVVRE